jgi:eukaryotic-like serine/threonine-protein kinase
MANSPTLTHMATQAGVLLGTAAYMSPEQAKAKPVDRRADIWAFGCVLYEMLTAKKAFPGETVTEALAATLARDPDWSQLPAATPVRVRVLLQRCLQKDPKQRLRDIGDARISLDEVLSGVPEAGLPAAGRVSSRRWLWLVSGVAAVLAVATAYLALARVRQRPPAVAPTMRFEITTPERFSLSSHFFALSPDGRELAFIGRDADGQNRLWVRSFESLDAQPLDGTEGADDRPFWSPDSRFIGFLSQDKLKKVDTSGGPPTVICDADGIWGGAWTKDDRILFGTNSGAMIVDASGGKPSQVINGLAATPLLLPDGRHSIYLGDWGASNPATGIYIGSIDAKSGQRSKKLLNDDSEVAYVPSSDPAIWRLLFVRGATPATSLGTLMEQRFDTRRLALIGEAIPVAQQVPNLSFGASPDVLTYMTNLSAAAPGGARGDVQGQLTWFDRNGKILEAVGEPGSIRTLALSPDGQRVVFERADPQGGTSRNLWLYEFARGVTTRFTLDSSWDTDPVWSPDGRRIVFGSGRDGGFNLYEKDSNSATEDVPVLRSNDNKLPSSWSPDGRFLLYFNPIPPTHIWLLPLAGEAGRKPVRMDDSEFNEGFGSVSPDGRWIAYHSDESGRYEIYVRPFDVSRTTGSSSDEATPVAGKWMVSKGGGMTALWRRDGKELFYLGLDGNAMAVEVRTSGEFQAAIPKVLFKVPQGVLFWDVSADGKRFLMPAPSAASAAMRPKFTVVLNWQAALKQ